MSDLIDTTEMYLKTIFELEEDGIVPLRARIADRLGHSGPTVSQTIARMERDGLVVLSGDRHLEFTDEGRGRATRVMRKHRLAERLLLDIIGLEWEYVHDEACRWEHVMSERVERKIYTLLKGDHTSPYGNAIPGLGEFGESEGPGGTGADVVSMARASGVDSRDFEVRRIGEPVQADPEALALLTAAGVIPGGRVTVRRFEGRVIAVGEGRPEADGVSLPDDVADHVFGARADHE